MKVQPSVDLHDGDSVSVTVSGFPPGAKVFLSQCARAVDVTSQGCGDQLAGQPFLVVDDSGAGRGDFRVRSQAFSRPNDVTDSAVCTEACVLVATAGFQTPVYATLLFGHH